MTWQQTIDEEKEIAFEEGQEKGRLEGAQAKAMENAQNLLKETDLSAEKIALCCSLPLEQVIALKEELTTTHA